MLAVALHGAGVGGLRLQRLRNPSKSIAPAVGIWGKLKETSHPVLAPHRAAPGPCRPSVGPRPNHRVRAGPSACCDARHHRRAGGSNVADTTPRYDEISWNTLTAACGRGRGRFFLLLVLDAESWLAPSCRRTPAMRRFVSYSRTVRLWGLVSTPRLFSCPFPHAGSYPGSSAGSLFTPMGFLSFPDRTAGRCAGGFYAIGPLPPSFSRAFWRHPAVGRLSSRWARWRSRAGGHLAIARHRLPRPPRDDDAVHVLPLEDPSRRAGIALFRASLPPKIAWSVTFCSGPGAGAIIRDRAALRPCGHPGVEAVWARTAVPSNTPPSRWAPSEGTVLMRQSTLAGLSCRAWQRLGRSAPTQFVRARLR